MSPILGYLRFLVLAVVVQVLGTHVVIECLDPWGVCIDHQGKKKHPRIAHSLFT